MAIEFLTLHEIRVPFLEPLVTRDAVLTERRSILVSLTDGQHTGWGEAAAFPSGRWGTADEAWAALVEAGPAGRPQVPVANAALQAARSDLEARKAGVSLREHFGGRRSGVVGRATIGLVDDPAAAVERIGGLVDRGLTAVKVKVSPGRDIEPILALRANFRDLDIGVDANAGYTDANDIVFDAFDHLGVSTIDQPFPADDMKTHAALRQRGLGMRVCLDETITSVARAVSAVAAHAADMVSVKVNRLGLEAAHSVLAAARTTGTGFKVGGTFDTSIGRHHLLAFATLAGVTDAEIAPPDIYLAADVADYPPLVDGTITPLDAAGIGVEPDPVRLAELEIRRA